VSGARARSTFRSLREVIILPSNDDACAADVTSLPATVVFTSEKREFLSETRPGEETRPPFRAFPVLSF